MGVIGNGTRDGDSNLGPKEVRETENVDLKPVSVEESSNGVNYSETDQGDKSKNIGDKRGVLLENMKISPTLENSEGAMLSQLIDFEDMDLPPGFSYPEPGNEKLDLVEIDVANDLGHLENSNNETPVQARNRKPKLKEPVSSSWGLRSKSQEKTKAPEPDADVKEGSADGEKKKRGRKKKDSKENTADEFSRKKTHLRYLLHRIKYEQNLIDAYSAEGWKGQSLEKLKPEKELERAKSHIIRYKLRIRDLFQQLDSALAVGKLPPTLFDSAGQIDSEDIFCAKCGSKDIPLDNDIILCDGACERGFHQFCLSPPLLKEHIPPGDESWLCPGCDCKVSCIDMLKYFQGTDISVTDSWEKIFPDAAAAASGKKLEEDSISSLDDSDDDDYDPDNPDKLESIEGENSRSEASKNVTTFSGNNMALPLDDSEDSEDDDFDPTAADPEEQVKPGSSSSDFSSDSEDLDGLIADSAEPCKDSVQISPLPDQMQGQSLKNELSCLIGTSEESVPGRRHVERLDYKKLHDETYGDYSSDSSDEDFGEGSTQKRRKINRERKVKSTNGTPQANNEMHTMPENKKDSPLAKDSSATVDSVSTSKKRNKATWIGEEAKKRLIESFNENKYPERDVRENLATELGLTLLQVTKWFGHARWSFNHKPKPEPNTGEKPSNPGISNGEVTEIQESGGNSGKRKGRKKTNKKDEAGASATQNTHEPNTSVKPPEPGNSTGAVAEIQRPGENSGKRKYRKRKGEKDQAGDNILADQSGQK